MPFCAKSFKSSTFFSSSGLSRNDTGGYNSDGKVPTEGNGGLLKEGNGTFDGSKKVNVKQQTFDKTMVDINAEYVVALVYISAHDESWGYKIDNISIERETS